MIHPLLHFAWCSFLKVCAVVRSPTTKPFLMSQRAQISICWWQHLQPGVCTAYWHCLVFHQTISWKVQQNLSLSRKLKSWYFFVWGCKQRPKACSYVNTYSSSVWGWSTGVGGWKMKIWIFTWHWAFYFRLWISGFLFFPPSEISLTDAIEKKKIQSIINIKWRTRWSPPRAETRLSAQETFPSPINVRCHNDAKLMWTHWALDVHNDG